MNEKPSKTILLVEDVDEISSHLSGMLTRKGHHVIRATSADEAIRIAQEDGSLLILTDLDLPGLDSLVKAVRANSKLDHVPVAVVDINHPQAPPLGINILSDFDQLDDLIRSLSRDGH